MSKPILWNYGDSWAAGSGIDRNKTYAMIITDSLGYRIQNYSQDGLSLAYMVRQFYENANRYSENDLVLITVPPDVRWMTVRDRGQGPKFEAMFNTAPEYKHFANSINGYQIWFKYCHGLFLQSIVDFCENRKIKLAMQHNYGYMDIDKIFDTNKIYNYFVDQKRSMWDWLDFKLTYIPDGNNYFDDVYNIANDGPLTMVESEYCLPDDNHPNELGHQKIAHTIMLYIEQKILKTP